jgi:hypothetical protein
MYAIVDMFESGEEREGRRGRIFLVSIFDHLFAINTSTKYTNPHFLCIE